MAERPQEAADRSVPGHWEADLMLLGNRGQSLLVLQERHSRLILAQPMLQKAADPMAQTMTQLLESLPPQWRCTVTFDNGSEFAQHYQLHNLGIQTFFCDTHSPWQKGGVENTNGRLRRFLPRKTNLTQLPEDLPLRVVQTYNNTPRKCLGYRTPAEIYSNQLLHLKCESTNWVDSAGSERLGYKGSIEPFAGVGYSRQWVVSSVDPGMEVAEVMGRCKTETSPPHLRPLNLNCRPGPDTGPQVLAWLMERALKSRTACNRQTPALSGRFPFSDHGTAPLWLQIRDSGARQLGRG